MKSKENILIGFLAMIKLAVHFVTNTNYELHRDSFLYYALGKHIDWGFVSVPTGIAVMSQISTFLFGNTTFALRFFPAVTGALSIVIIGLIIKELGGKFYAIFIGCLAFLLTPAFLRSNTLFQPVSFDQFFWLLSGLFIVKLINTQNAKHWIYIFIVWAVGFWFKYSMVFFAGSMTLGILISRHRKLILSKQFIIGGLTCFIIILPNIIWQYQHNWPLFKHYAELKEYQFSNVSVTGFIIDQFIMSMNTFILWLIALIILLVNKNEHKYRFVAFAFFILISSFLYFKGKSYYTLGIYPVLFAFGGYFAEKYLVNSLKFLRYALPVFMMFMLIGLLPYSLPIYKTDKMVEFAKKTAKYSNNMVVRWEDGQLHDLPQDFADMMCWKELSDIVIKAYNGLSDREKKNCNIYAEQYCYAGAIMFYGKKHGLPDPICFNDNFLLWAPDTITSDVCIYVNKEIGDMKWAYSEINEEGRINNKYFRENGVMVLVCKKPSEPFFSFYKEKVKNLKNTYNGNNSKIMNSY